MSSMVPFKGKEARNDEAIIRALGRTPDLTTWDLTRLLLIDEKQADNPEYKPYYDEIRSKNSVIYRSLRHLTSAGYIRNSGTRLTKGNEVPLHTLTFKGFLVAASLLEDKEATKLIDANYDSLMRGTPNTFLSDAELLLGLWKILSKKDAKVFNSFFKLPIKEIMSVYNLEAFQEGAGLIFYLMETVGRDLLACLAGIKRLEVHEALVQILERDVHLAKRILHAIDWYWIKASVDLDNVSSQVRVTSTTVFAPALEKYKCEDPEETETREEVMKTLDDMRRREMVTKIRGKRDSIE